jgi:ankyrin repeat protein
MKVGPIPTSPDVAFYDKQAKELAKRFASADHETLYLIRQWHPRLPGRRHTNDRNPITRDDVRRVKVTLADARSIVAGAHQFENWRNFTKHLQALNDKDSSVRQFETAADAIVNGDAKTLKRLLGENPDLIGQRSTREHRATLLHYVGANAVEQYRQKSPKNAAEIAAILLKAGAEVDADLDYGAAGPSYPERTGSTTLGLVATSCHPAAAGVQIQVMDLLIDHGASVDGLQGGWNPLIAALHNGRGEAAAHLAKRGAKLDVEGAAGAGRLDALKKLFRTADTKAELGLMWACEYGHARVVEFLLSKGVDMAAQPHGETGLHWAAFGGHGDVVKTLLKRKAPLELKDKRFGGTPLGWALYGWSGEKKARYYEVVARLVRAGAAIPQDWISNPDRRMKAALEGKLAAR